MAAPGPPPVTVDLNWDGELRFTGRSGAAQVTLDGAMTAGPSPTQALAVGLAGCMAIDVVQILTKGGLGLAGLTARLVAERRSEPPRHLVRVDLHFVVAGEVPPEKVERAIALSRDKHCSVWHSLRPDIDLRTSFEVVRARPGRSGTAPGRLRGRPP